MENAHLDPLDVLENWVVKESCGRKDIAIFTDEILAKIREVRQPNSDPSNQLVTTLVGAQELTTPSTTPYIYKKTGLISFEAKIRPNADPLVKGAAIESFINLLKVILIHNYKTKRHL